ncbi:putative aminoacrylate hydrolase [Lachnellula occidentalis]|uniref:Putative aminoacrylate hydrolase n=1 Tax=Lachnellula occidentalis TaxID=215460 RepID=A0A8H8S2C0_9HELO|nr:putative aminoacrylate hydrolase [Lachnellula occidentalis]
MPSKHINGKSLYYTIDEPAQKALATVILIHGLGSSSSYFLPVIPYLNPSIRCIAIDMPGSGLSELGESEQTIDSIVKDVVSLLDALNVKNNVTIVGHSMGGIVASQFAVKHGKRVNGVVLIGPVNPSDAISQVFATRIEAVKQDGIEGLAQSIPTAATGALSTPLHHAFIRNLIIRTLPEGYMSLCSVISTAKVPDYGAITVPLLLIAGSDDRTAPMEGCEAIMQRYGSSDGLKSIKVLDGVGHWHCIEAGDVVAKHINDFALSEGV